MSMFEQTFVLFQNGVHRCLILLWLLATIPHTQFVMCYFNRISGKL